MSAETPSTDTNILQLGDTELQGVPSEDILEQYEAGDLDAIVYHGDGSKKGVGAENYINQLQDTYDELDNLGGELDTEVYVLPGNHEPRRGIHTGGDEEVKEFEQQLEEEYEDFVEGDDAYEFLVGSKDNLVNLEHNSADVGDYTLVGGSDHFGPELGNALIGADFTEDPELEQIGYGEDELEEVAAHLEDETETDYGFIGDLPLIGKAVKYIGDFLGYGSEDIDPDEIGLEDIPDELKTDEHEAYEQAVEQVEGELESEVNKVGEMIEEADGEVLFFDHGMPYSDEAEVHPDEIEGTPKGSMMVKEVLQGYGEDIVMMGGGHFHTADTYDMYGTDIVNSAEAYTEIGLSDGGLEYTEQYEMGSPQQGQQQLSEEERRAIQIMEMEQMGGPDEYWENVEGRIDEAAEQGAVPEEHVDEFKQQKREEINQTWEMRDEINPEEVLEDSDLMGDAPEAQPAA